MKRVPSSTQTGKQSSNTVKTRQTTQRLSEHCSQGQTEFLSLSDPLQPDLLKWAQWKKVKVARTNTTLENVE